MMVSDMANLPVKVGGRRIREQDTLKHRKTLQRCKARTMVSGAVFRCSYTGPHDEHAEFGLIKQRGRQDVEYHITWHISEPPKVIRNG